MSATGGSMSGQVTTEGGRSMTGEGAGETEGGAAVPTEPLCVCGHSLRKHQTRGIPEACKRSRCRCRCYLPRAPWDGPYDWNDEIEEWVCQAHGVADCRQTLTCEHYGRLAAAGGIQ